MDIQPKALADRDDQVAHLRDYWRIIWRHRWTVGAISLGVVLVAGVWSFLQTPVYKATSKVVAQTQTRRAISGPDVSGLGASGFGWSAEERFYSTEIEIIKSRGLADRVIKRLALHDDPLYRQVPDLTGMLSNSVQCDLLKDTGVVEISMANTDPRRAAEFANAYAKEYVQRNYDIARQSVENMVKEMNDQLTPLLTEIKETEKQRIKIAQDKELYVPENQEAIIEANLKKYSDELAEVKIKLSELDGVLSGLAAVRRSGGDPLTIGRIAEDSEVKNLISQRSTHEQDLQKLLVKFRPNAPEVKEVQSKLDAVKERLADRVNSMSGTLEAEHALLAKNSASLQAHIDDSRRESFETGQKTSDYKIAATDVETRQKVYDSLQQTVKQVALQAGLLNNNLTMLDEATVPTAPISPNTRLNLLMGAIIGAMLGLGAAFFLDYLDNTIKSSDDIEQFLRLHLLAVIPRYRETTGHAVKEAYQTLRTSVLFSSKGRQHRVLLVTSAGPREGKTSTIVNLARTIASAGERVVLLDCDLRRPRVHEDLEMQREPGITNFLAGMEGDDYRKFLKPTSQPNFMALTCGPIPPNPPELFGMERFRELLATLRKDFDWVLVDSPPVVSVTDAVILSDMVDMVAFVVKHNENDRDLIRRSVNSIRNVNSNVIGAVLNNVDIERGGSEYYYTGYYYTTEGEEGTKKTRKARTKRDSVGVAK